jgi:GAF domain-containing protein
MKNSMNKKHERYQRINHQFTELLNKSNNPSSRLASLVALLHHKMDNFFWTGVYWLNDGKLQVGGYQGPLACMELEKDKGVCWAAINENKAIVVPDVDKYPGHIACDSRSKSEIALPVRDKNQKVLGVLDIDSNKLNNFDGIDATELERLIQLCFTS